MESLDNGSLISVDDDEGRSQQGGVSSSLADSNSVTRAELTASSSLDPANYPGRRSENNGYPSRDAASQAVRFRGRKYRSRTSSVCSDEHTAFGDALDLDFEVMHQPENEIEAHRMANNYLFGFRKWKSHVSSRPLETRSQVVQRLYKEDFTEAVRLCTFGNVMYVILFGWWVSLVYLLMALLCVLTVVGFSYSKFCVKLAAYFIWPFGKFVYKAIPQEQELEDTSFTERDGETTPLNAGRHSQDQHSRYTSAEEVEMIDITPPQRTLSTRCYHKETGFWKRPATYVWLLLGVPVMAVVHFAAFFVTWYPVVSIPIAKIHISTMHKLALLPPELLRIHSSNVVTDEPSGDIVMYTYQAFNKDYFKYSVDGMNVFFVNKMFVVLITICAGYLDTTNRFFSMSAKFVLSLLSIIPLAYYIGMSISSLAAQSSYAVGAVLNATFGSVVEIILYLSALYKGKKENKALCYQVLVKAGLVGTLLATTMLIPGMAMIVGGIKHQSQRFNPTSAGVTATLLFVSVAAVFAPTIFSQSYSMLTCDQCHAYNISDQSEGLQCQSCRSDELGVPANNTMYKDHVLPLVYTCTALLPLAYIIGMVYSLKTHKALVHDTFVSEVGGSGGHGHGTPQWGRIKSGIILLVSVVLMSLCADILTYNIQPLLNSGLSVYFVGVTLLALVPDIPEIVIGIQFALQNNITLSIEMGSCIAVQVCMLQIPVLILADLIHSNGFYLLFSEIHIWTVVIGVLLNNYVFQDGKSNYFQGSALVLTYCALVAMYFFAPNPPKLVC